MEEKLSEREILSIGAEKYIDNHNNVLFQGGYSIPTGHKQQNYYQSEISICEYFYWKGLHHD